jgi:hypothetical protein
VSVPHNTASTADAADTADTADTADMVSAMREETDDLAA